MTRGHGSARRIEVEDKHLKLRIVLMVLAIIIAVTAFSYGIHALLRRNSGWQSVDAYPDGVDCSGDFTLQYYFDAVGASATVEYKAVSAVYTTALEEAYQLYYPEGGLVEINAHPNEEVEVAPALYRALEVIQAAGNRSLYLAPVYVEYDRIFLHQNEDEAARYDPGQDDEIAAYVAELASFANDPTQIDLELLGGNRVRLNVADDYLAYAKENGITEYLDFGWMKNAFITDYIADALIQSGYKTGYIASFDGFTRNLDESGQSYSFNLFDRLDEAVYCPAVMSYTGPMSIVYLRNYPLSNADRWHYFSFSSGRIASVYVDPEDGMSKSATDNLVAYSAGASCSEILMKIAPIYLTDVLDEAALEMLAEQQIHTIWFEGPVLKHTQESLQLTGTEDAKTMGYQFS